MQERSSRTGAKRFAIEAAVREFIAQAGHSRMFAPKSEWPLMALMTINVVFVTLVIFAWAFVSLVISEPLAWATWMPVGRSWRPGMFEYPFTLLWALPGAGIVSAWSARKARNMSAAYFAAGVPIIILTLMFAWYYMTPIEWH
jgi:hypothetical protein